MMNINLTNYPGCLLRSGVTALAAFAALLAVCLVSAASPETLVPDTGEKIAEVIRAEVLRAPFSEEGRPFPLAATWAPLSHNFSPDYQIGLIKQGHHLLLCFRWPYAISDKDWSGNAQTPKAVQGRLENFKKYYEPALREASRLKLPISFYRFQFEMELTSDKKYFGSSSNGLGSEGRMIRGEM